MLEKIENLLKNPIFAQQIEILVKNRNFGQKSKFWPKIEILVKNRNFGQESKYWSKIGMFFKNGNLDQKSKFFSISNYWSKLEILLKTRNLAQKSQFLQPPGPRLNQKIEIQEFQKKIGLLFYIKSGSSPKNCRTLKMRCVGVRSFITLSCAACVGNRWWAEFQ